MSAISENLVQLYRFCFLMTGDEIKAQEAFEGTVREAAARTARDQAPSDRVWFFRDARMRCLAMSEKDLQAEPIALDETDISIDAPKQIGRLDATQLAAWISAAPEPQRSALAFFYLDEFDLSEILAVVEVKVEELATLISTGRRQFQAWLDATTPHQEE